MPKKDHQTNTQEIKRPLYDLMIGLSRQELINNYD